MAAKAETDLRAELTRFFQWVGGAAVLVVLMHLVAPRFAGPHHALRRFFAVAYFSGLLCMCWMMLEARSQLTWRVFQWRYADCPPTIERGWKSYLHALDRAVVPAIWILLAFLAATAHWVLWAWFSGLGTLAPIFNLAWWLSLIALFAFPFAFADRLSAVSQRRQVLDEQIATGDYKPRALSDYRPSDAEVERPAVVLRGSGRFDAGGIEWRWEEIYNMIVFGQTRTGKTVCVLNAMLDGLLGSVDSAEGNPSGLILDPKGDFRGKLDALCRRHGRSGDLLVIDPADPQRSIRWNPLDSDDNELELASRFAAVLECLGMKNGDNSFWVDSAKKFIRHAIALVRLTNPAGTPPCFADISALASSDAAIAERIDALDVENARCDACLTYFSSEWLKMAGDQRSGVQSYITNMIDPFLMEPYASMFSGRSTVRAAEMIREGRIFYVHMPIAAQEAMARMVGTFVKLEYFREVLKALNKRRPSFFLCDEFQSFFTVGQGKGDADFFERSGQSNHVNIIATQNINALFKQSQREAPVENLLGNCPVKVFLRNGDRKTNEYAANLFGQDLATFGGVNLGGGGRGGGPAGVFGRTQGATTNTQYDFLVRPERFAELAIPSRLDGRLHCETFIHQGNKASIERLPRKYRWKVHPIESTEREAC